MKNLYFTFLSLTCYLCFGQCPTSDITLSSQAEVNSFSTNYPGCTDLDYKLIISGNDITDLTPLSNITSLHALSIQDNLALVNLNGLQSLINIDGNNENSYEPLLISNNSQLQDINALLNMSSSSVIESVIIANNPQLTSLNGLQGLSNVYQFTIDNNDVLTNLEGLNSLTLLDDLYISNNDNLVSFAGTQNLALVGAFVFSNNDAMLSFSTLNSLNICGILITDNNLLQDLNGIGPIDPSCGVTVIITGNSNLSTCNSSWVCERIPAEFATIEINNNNVGCNNIQEVAFECNLEPSNDNCDAALTTTLNESVAAYSDFGSQSAQVPSCNDVNRIDVWFVYNSLSASLIDISVDAGNNLQLWEGNCGSLTQVANACGLDSLQDIVVSPNTDYYIQVWSSVTTLQKTSGLFNLIVQDATLSVEEFNDNSIEIYPNPVHSTLNVKGDQIISSLKVFNAIGQLVIETQPNYNLGMIDLTTFSSGVYFLKVQVNNKFKTYKVIKN